MEILHPTSKLLNVFLLGPALDGSADLLNESHFMESVHDFEGIIEQTLLLMINC